MSTREKIPSDPAEHEAMLARLQIPGAAGPGHAFFGPMPGQDGRRRAWLHTDHHLRQFGR